MSELVEKNEERFTKSVKAQMAKRGVVLEPTLLPMKEAALRLGVTRAELRTLTQSHVVMSITEEGQELVPVSEITRLMESSRSKPLTSKQMKLAAKISAIVNEPPGARAALLRVRNSARGQSPKRN